MNDRARYLDIDESGNEAVFEEDFSLTEDSNYVVDFEEEWKKLKIESVESLSESNISVNIDNNSSITPKLSRFNVSSDYHDSSSVPVKTIPSTIESAQYPSYAPNHPIIQPCFSSLITLQPFSSSSISPSEDSRFSVDSTYHEKYLVAMNKPLKVHGQHFKIGERVHFLYDFDNNPLTKKAKFSPFWTPARYYVKKITLDNKVLIKDADGSFSKYMEPYQLKRVARLIEPVGDSDEDNQVIE